jgi:hypothetical protein
VIKNTNTLPKGASRNLTIYCHSNFGQYNGTLARIMHAVAVQSFLLLNITVNHVTAIRGRAASLTRRPNGQWKRRSESLARGQ